MNIEFIESDQNWTEEKTTYWFKLTGTDYGTDIEFNGETFGVVESGCDTPVIVAADGSPLTNGDHAEIAVRRNAVVTDEMRNNI